MLLETRRNSFISARDFHACRAWSNEHGVSAITFSSVARHALTLPRTSLGKACLIFSQFVHHIHLSRYSPSKSDLARLCPSQVPASWECPTGKFHVGVKPLYELYPEKLRKRIQSEYKDKQWVKYQAAALAEALSRQQVRRRRYWGGLCVWVCVRGAYVYCRMCMCEVG